MTKVKLPNKSSVVFDGHQVPGLSQVLSVNNDGGGLQIKNIGNPTDNQDAVTLAYFNAHSSPGGVTSFNSRIGAIIPLVGDYSSFYWSLSSGGTLTGPNTITGTTSNTLKFSFASLGTTQTDGAGIWLQNATLANVGAQQISPSITWEGQGNGSNTIQASQSVRYTADVLTIQGSSSPSGTWRLRSSINGSAYADNISVSSDGVVDVITNLNSTNLFSQRWSDSSSNVLMSFGFIGATSLSPALKIIGQTRSNDVELALVQTNTVPRDYGMYFLCEKTTSDFSIWVRKNNVDQKTFTIYNTDGTFNFNNSGNIGGSLGITNALTVGTTLSVTSTSAFTGNMSFTKNASGTSLFQLTNTNASGATQISFQNDGSNASIAAYSSGIAAYKILSGGDFHIYKPTSGDINILNDASSGKIQLAAGGSSTANLIINSAGGSLTFSQNGQSSAWIPALTSTPGAHTGMTASTEFISRDFKGATQTWLDGTTTTQRFNYFRGYTANKTTISLVFGDIYNVYIEQTTLNTGVSATNGNWALGVAGNAKMTGSRILLTGLPTSASGLPTGALWNNSGVINIAP